MKRPMLVLGLMALIPPIVVGAAEAVAWLLYHDEPTWDEPAPYDSVTDDGC